jgi:hypothetical protein
MAEDAVNQTAATPALEVMTTLGGPAGSTMSPLTTQTGLVTGAEDSDGNTVHTAGTFETVTGPREKIARIRSEHGGDVGDGGTSDIDGDGFDILKDFEVVMHDVHDEQLQNDHNEIEESVDDGIDNATLSGQPSGSALPGAPAGWFPPTAPDTWTPMAQKVAKGEPDFEAIDNPGKWSNFTFRAKFSGKNRSGTYTHHATPAGARVLPVDEATGKRTKNGFEFHYQGWKMPVPNDKYRRIGSTKENFFPDDRGSKVDGAYLTKMGLTPTRMRNNDALFFAQLIMPVCDPSKSGIIDDPRQSYYTDVAAHTNTYALDKLGWGGIYSRRFNPSTPEEHVNLDGIYSRNKNENILDNYDVDSELRFDKVIAETMGVRRLLDLKRSVKLCRHYEEKGKGEVGYDPTQKYRLIWDVVTHNTLQCMERGGLDITIDETTWPNASYADMNGRLRGKKSSKGGQHTIAVDAKTRYLYAWTPRHKGFEKKAPFTQEGPMELKRLCEEITPLVIGEDQEEDDKRRQIFTEKPCFGMDNHFSGDHVDAYLGEHGFKGIYTRQRGRLHKGLKEYYHHEKQVDIGPRSRAARFEHPVVAVKEVNFPTNDGKQDYCIVHVSFQSTGSTNITSVNALDKVDLYVAKRERGRGGGKRTWAIEMNEARDFYLKTYGGVDKLDQMLEKWGLRYVTWRWWHAPMQHGKAIGFCTAYQLYRECALGDVMPHWKVDKPMSGPMFRDRLAQQQCMYRSADTSYPGDNQFHSYKQLNKKQRARRMAALEEAKDGKRRVSYSCWSDEKFPRSRSATTRLCSDDIGLLKEHLASFKGSTDKAGRGKCVVCGKMCFWKCTLCPGQPRMCLKENRSGNKMGCALDWHNDDYFGLCLPDRVKYFGEYTTKYKKPTPAETRKNAAHIKAFRLKKIVESIGLA